ncbi:MAG TPA: TetR/AcrR family transcriptional regulator [Cytophagales bacterium]|nr:TetR/AcrR family transcriptional regulator [Cytophagales bacterium]
MTDHTPKEDDKLYSILNAAQKKFAQFGLSKTTMNDIALELGMGKASLYYYFTCKEQLFEAVVAKEKEEFIENIKKSIRSAESGIALLEVYVKKRQVHFEKCLNLSRLKHDSLASSPVVCKLLGDFYKKEAEVVQTILEIGVANGEFIAHNTAEKADFLILVMQGLRLATIKRKNDTILSKQDHIVLTKNLNKVVDMFIRSIQK